MIYTRMPGYSPKIKFSPFEALLIGEKNKIVKRQPLRNAIFVTRLSKVRKTINLRELFDLKNAPPKKRITECKKTEKRKNLYCFEFEGRKLIVKGNEFVEFKVKPEKNEKKKCVKFKPDFKFKETLEEKIVNKFQNRRKNHLSKPNIENRSKRLLARSPSKYETHKLKSLSIYIERLCEKKIQENCRRDCDDDCKVVKEIIRSPPVLNNRVAKKFCENYSPPLIRLPPYPKNIKQSDFDDNECLMDILNEHRKDRPKELKVYRKKKSISSDIEVVYDSRLDSEDENRRLKLESERRIRNLIRSKRRNGFNSRIDEPLNIDDHLIEGTNLGTLFFNTSNGDNVFLGNFVRPFLVDSPFGSLPSV